MRAQQHPGPRRVRRPQALSSAVQRLLRSGALLAAAAAAGLPAASAWAGGGGENAFMLVNPNDENALRIANAYAKLRNIPDCNFIFIAPTVTNGATSLSVPQAELISRYATPIENAINSRGLRAQIDYIGAIGAPIKSPSTSVNADAAQSFTDSLAHLTQLADGTFVVDGLRDLQSKLYQSKASYTLGGNPAVHHSQTYTGTVYDPVTKTNVQKTWQYYVGAQVAVTAINGNTTDQAINSLTRAAAADGTKPVGTVYFEDNDDVRTSVRSDDWPWTITQLNSRGVPTVREPLRDANFKLIGTPTNSPQNRNDVRGAVTGSAGLVLPNGSTYLGGSWADNMTSAGAIFEAYAQTKATMFIAAGAAGTSGAVAEPYAISNRFPEGSVHVFVADGSTLGEAVNKSVVSPFILSIIGDMLAQPYADVPQVQISSGPAEGASVSGTVNLGASASLTSPTLATGVKQLELYIDGKLKSTLSGDSATFPLDTATLSDGRHELRIVGVNNSQAESEGYLIRHVSVDNHGRAVSLSGGDRQVDAKNPFSVQVAANTGLAGTVSRIELRHLGRTLGTLNGASGSISVDPKLLAYDQNPLVPVAIYSDNSEVYGTPITVTRSRPVKGGSTPLPLAQRVPGMKTEYFINKGNTTIAGSAFTGTPNLTALHSKLKLRSDIASRIYDSDPGGAAEHLDTPSIYDLAVRVSGLFNITSATAGEYQFFFVGSNDSVRLSIDGEQYLGFDGQQYGSTTNWSPSAFLDPGQHTFEVLAANTYQSGTGADNFDIYLEYRGPDGIMRAWDSSIAYVPEPSSLAWAGAGLCLLARRRRRR